MRGFPGRLAILGALHKKSPKGKTLTRSWEDRLVKRRAGLLAAHLTERNGKT